MALKHYLMAQLPVLLPIPDAHDSFKMILSHTLQNGCDRGDIDSDGLVKKWFKISVDSQ